MHKSFSYKEFTSRNYLYITEEMQEKIKNKKLAFFGTGLSSMIVEHCVRLGFMNIYLHDGDKIELSNLNRQSFNFDEIGCSKAQALKNKILKVNPTCNISMSKTYVSRPEDFTDQIDSADIIVNTVDCNRTYFDIIEYARSKDKLVICPFNPGFSGLVICFTKDSSSSHEVFDTSNELNDIEIAKQLFMKYPEIKTLEHAHIPLDEFLSKSSHYFPQITVGALITTSLTLITILKFLGGENITLAPFIFYKNFY